MINRLKMTGWRTLGIICLLYILCGSGAAQQNAGAVVGAEDAAVYAAVASGLYSKGNQLLVIDKRVSGCTKIGNNQDGERAWQAELNKLVRKMPGLLPQTLQSFKQNARLCRSLPERLPLAMQMSFLSTEQRKALFIGKETRKAWSNFYQQFPSATGFINFSNVGFNADQTQALVNTFRKCGEKCGGEYIVLLAKANGQWTIQSKVQVWEM